MASAATPFETLPAYENGCSDSRFVSTALELLEALRAEEQIIRRFSAAELLALLPKKEYLVNELEWKLRAAKDSNEPCFAVSDSFKAILAEISRLNTANGVFIERSLSYWQDLQAILLPPGYSRTGGKGATSARPPRGLTFQQEI
ncbi:MAG: hypothetical protein P4L43_18530 [Syntrophobacteraceae bacterium]|nr:hypothetical protein [Syntrophobacteraceae bacterium]